MKLSLVMIISFVLQFAYAKTEFIEIQKSQIQTVKTKGLQTFSSTVFTQVSVEGFKNTAVVGAPSLPVKTWVLVGTPETITVDVKVNEEEVIENTLPFPVQKQPCRCADDLKNEFSFNMNLFKNQMRASSNYELKYLGMYKGTPVTQLTVNLAKYNSFKNEVSLKTDVEVHFEADVFELEAEELTNLFIVVPEALVDGLVDFVAWKESQGYRVTVSTVTSVNSTKEALSQMIQEAYDNKLADFVMLIGDENTLPMFSVVTMGSYRTPSDLKYFLMDGPDDKIPDMYTSRIAANSVNAVKNKLAKAIEFEQRSYNLQTGLKTVIGIASNEGYGTTDDDYIKSIEEKFENQFGFNSVHFHQDDPKSNPRELNKALSDGAIWLAYMGHGSGQAWPSMYEEYHMSDFAQIKNKNAVKPIVIDIACQNGRLKSNHLGISFMDVLDFEQSEAFGAAAYYGGSVDIAWHPPAIMAVGIAEMHSQKNYKHLGQALLAGQMYLAGQWDAESDILDNLEWFHLQGDPSMNIKF